MTHSVRELTGWVPFGEGTLHTTRDAESIAARLAKTAPRDDHEIHGTQCVHEWRTGGTEVRCEKRSTIARHGWLCEQHQEEVHPPMKRVVVNTARWITA